MWDAKIGLGLRLLLVVSTIYGASTNEQAQPRDDGDTDLGRLPTTLYPIHYQVEVLPDFYTGEPPFFFNGTVSIRFEVKIAASIIYLNSFLLAVPESGIQIWTAIDSPVSAPNPVWISSELNEDFHFFKLFLDDALVVGAHYYVSLDFSGRMKSPSDREALWWDSYVSQSDGQTKYVVNTQFQRNHASEVFPCFDEPSYKATFDVTLLRQNQMVALSNMPLISSVDRGNGWTADTFNTTAYMSSYLLAFAIGDFDYLESTTSSGTVVRVWARPEYKHDLGYANSIAAQLQEWYENWTGIDYPLPKQDHLAVPNKSGAMENWGLILYGEDYLLYNPDNYTLYDQRRVAQVIGHEIAHMWFGNLVTCHWWTDTWLNEGFAAYFESLPADDVLDWDTDMRAMERRIEPVLDIDSVNTSTAVRVKIDYPWDSQKAFGTITYSKGSAVLRMLSSVLGSDTFRRGIQRYLNAHAYGNTKTDDLWTALTEQAQDDGITDTDGLKLFIKEKFDPWTDQRGYPLITANRTTPGVVQFTQEPFLSPNYQTVGYSPFQNEWYAPLAWTSQTVLDFTAPPQDWLNRDNKTLGGFPTDANEWFLLNTDHGEFVRVLYDSENYALLTSQLETNSTVLPYQNRFQIVNDAFSISRAGYQEEVVAMETTKYLDQEQNFLVWNAVEEGLSYQALMFSRYPTTELDFETYIRTKLDPVYDVFGWTNQPGEDNYRMEARATILRMSCSYRRTECLDQAQAYFNDLFLDPNNNVIPPDQRLNVYCSAVRQSGVVNDWDFLRSQYLSIATSVMREDKAERDRLLTAMACPPEDAILQQYISDINSGVILSGDAPEAYDALANAREGRFSLWTYLKANWNNNPVPANINQHSLLLDIVRGFGNEQDVLQVEDFIQVNPPASQADTDTYAEMTAVVNANKAWNDENQGPFSEWLQSNTPASAISQKTSISVPAGNAWGDFHYRQTHVM